MVQNVLGRPVAFLTGPPSRAEILEKGRNGKKLENSQKMSEKKTKKIKNDFIYWRGV